MCDFKGCRSITLDIHALLLSAVFMTWNFGLTPRATEAAQEERIDVLPTCGVASVYTVLRQHGINASIADVEGTFRRNAPDCDLRMLSFKDLRLACEAYGLHVTCVRVATGDVHAIPRSAVLHLSSEKGSIGHFAVLQSIESGTARLLDLSRSVGEVSVPIAKLKKSWKGEMLIVSDASMSQLGYGLKVALSTISILAVLVITRVGGRGRTRPFPLGRP